MLEGRPVPLGVVDAATWFALVGIDGHAHRVTI
jgi:hypothetical protein